MMTVEKYYASLKKYAPTQGLILNSDWEIVKLLLEALLKNGERYGLRTCPCRPAVRDPQKDSDLCIFKNRYRRIRRLLLLALCFS